MRPAAEEAAREFPRVAQEEWDRDPEQLRERKFRYGLDRVLDGLEARRNT
ncbi:hypothetical protein [Nocardia abscessus]|nr:hypothetical protein [Nocardia abscessus]